MNKAKLLYDVVRVLKNKEKIEGVLSAYVQKDQVEVFSLRNQFTKDGATARTAVSCELSLDGKKVKRESTTEFSGSELCCHGGMRRLFHHHHHRHHGGEERCGIKGALSRISFVLGLFSSLKAEEKDDGAAVLSIKLSEIPEELQALLRDKLNQRAGCHGHCGFLEGNHTVQSLDGLALLTVNKEREIEKLSLHLDGRALNEKDEPHTLTATADVQFAW
jgi:hypothetical protein